MTDIVADEAPSMLTPSDRVKSAMAELSQTHGPDRLAALEVVVRELAWEMVNRLREAEAIKEPVAQPQDVPRTASGRFKAKDDEDGK